METREQQGLYSACPLCHLIIGPQSLSHLPWQCRFCGAEAAWHSIKSKRHRQACAQEPFRGCWTECAFQVRFPSDSDPPLWSIFVCGRGLAKSMTASQTSALVDKTCCLLVALSYLNRTGLLASKKVSHACIAEDSTAPNPSSCPIQCAAAGAAAGAACRPYVFTNLFQSAPAVASYVANALELGTPWPRIERFFLSSVEADPGIGAIRVQVKGRLGGLTRGAWRLPGLLGRGMRCMDAMAKADRGTLVSLFLLLRRCSALVRLYTCVHKKHMCRHTHTHMRGHMHARIHVQTHVHACMHAQTCGQHTLMQMAVRLRALRLCGSIACLP